MMFHSFVDIIFIFPRKEIFQKIGINVHWMLLNSSIVPCNYFVDEIASDNLLISEFVREAQFALTGLLNVPLKNRHRSVRPKTLLTFLKKKIFLNLFIRSSSLVLQYYLPSCFCEHLTFIRQIKAVILLPHEEPKTQLLFCCKVQDLSIHHHLLKARTNQIWCKSPQLQLQLVLERLLEPMKNSNCDSRKFKQFNQNLLKSEAEIIQQEKSKLQMLKLFNPKYRRLKLYFLFEFQFSLRMKYCKSS